MVRKLFFLLIFLIPISCTAEKKKEVLVQQSSIEKAEATFAAGCFWCIQPVFDEAEGVIETHVGFSGGTLINPTYEKVATGTTNHAESIEVTYDPKKISYQKLLDLFWDNINPADGEGQFADRGSQYRPAIFYHDDEQKKLALESKQKLEDSKKYSKPIVVEISEFKFFVPVQGEEAETHEKYYKKNPIRYHLYKEGSGRASFLRKNHP